MTNQDAMQIATDRLIYSLNTAPHTVYCEAMRRKSALLDSYSGKTKRGQEKALADCDRLTRVIRAYYALRAA